MAPLGDRRHSGLRIVLVGTGTGVGKTHVACSLLHWSTAARVAGLKPVETGVGPLDGGSSAAPDGGTSRAARRRRVSPNGALSDQELLARSAGVFHVKRGDGIKRSRRVAPDHPLRSLFAFPDPISPHLAARQHSVRLDLGLIERWVAEHEAPMTVVETAGGLFSPLGHGATNFELTQALHPHAVILVAVDRLGVLHDLTTTLALAAARGGIAVGVVLSTPARRDASTGRNAAEIAALGIAEPLAVFPRATVGASSTADAAREVLAWAAGGGRPPSGRT